MIEHVTVKFAAALAALAVLAAGTVALQAHSDRTANEGLRRLVTALASAVDGLSRQETAGSVLLTGDDGVLPHTFRGRPYVITFSTISVELLWEGRSVRAGLSSAIDPAVGLRGRDATLGSELDIWALRLRAPGILTTVEVR